MPLAADIIDKSSIILVISRSVKKRFGFSGLFTS
jgi:hypothetical protein